MPDQITQIRSDKATLEREIQALLSAYMAKHQLPVVRVNATIEEYHTTPFCSGVDVEVKIWFASIYS